MQVEKELSPVAVLGTTLIEYNESRPELEKLNMGPNIHLPLELLTQSYR